VGTDNQVSSGLATVEVPYQSNVEKLYEKTERSRAAFLARLVGLTNANEMAHLVFAHISSLMPCESGALLLKFGSKFEKAFETVFSFDTDVNGLRRYDDERHPVTLTPDCGTTKVLNSGGKIIIHRTKAEQASVILDEDDLLVFFNRPSASLIYCPLIIQKEIIGVLTVQSYQFEAYQDNHIAILESIVADVSMALAVARMTDALAKSEHRYQELYNNAPVGLFRTSLSDGKMLECNDCFAKIANHKNREECINEWVSTERYVDPNARLQMLAQLRENGHVENFETQIFRKNGEIAWVRFSARVYPNLGYLEGVGTEITEEKLAQEKIKDLAKFPDENPSPVMRIAKDGTLLYANAACQPLFKHWQCEKEPHLPSDIIDKLNAVLLTGQKVELEIECKERVFTLILSPAATSEYINIYGREITERKKTEKQLQVEKAYLEQLFNSAPEAIVLLNKEHEVIRINNEFARMFGYTPEEARNRSVDNLLAPEEKHQEAQSLTRRIMAGETISLETVRYRKDKTPVNVSILGTPIIMDGGQIAVYAIYRDITEQKKAEEALSYSEDRFRNIFEKGPLGIALTDPEFRFIKVNPAICQMLGYDEKELIGLTFREISHPDDLKDSLELSTQLRQGTIGDFAIQKRYIRKDGQFIWANLKVSAIRDGNGEYLYAIAILEDITEQRYAADALKESEEKYKSLVEAMPNGLSISDLQGNIIFVNPMACWILGYSREELGKMNLSQFVVEDEVSRVDSQTEKRIQGEISDYELTIRKKDGQLRSIAITGAPLYDNLGAVKATIGIFSDITEFKNSETERQELREKLIRAQRMESLGVLAGGVAHDLNNILGPLVAYPELIRMKLPPDSPVTSQISKIESSAQRAAEIVQDLLTMARRGRYEMAPANLNKVIEGFINSTDFYDLKMRFPSSSININLDESLPAVHGSVPHLYKVIMNLVINAFDAMPHGGELSLRTECRQIDRLICGYDNIESGSYVILTVSDTGIGIDTKDFRRIFEPFYTKKVMGKSGSGLGLAIVYGVVKDHNGYIDVQSEINKGSSFIIYLPASDECATSETTKIVDIHGSEKILVVDDVAEQRELASTILSSLGYKVEVAAHGHEAMEFFKSNKVDVLVLDMIMEPDFDGLDTYREIIKLHPGQKAIITSGFSETDRVKEAEKLGVGRYIKKPYTMQKLGKAIREVMDRY
jgi:PAS domain S-box-containing protein